MRGIDKECILETYLELVREQEGLQGVNFREIARRIGCNHTNLYNYFSSFEELRCTALAYLVQRMRSELLTGTEQAPENQLRVFIESLVRFALQNPGWYRFLWLEKMPREDLSSILAGLPRPEDLLEPVLIRFFHPQKKSSRELRRIGAFAHGYLHGELTKFICGRQLKDKDCAQLPRYLANEILHYLLLNKS